MTRKTVKNPGQWFTKQPPYLGVLYWLQMGNTGTAYDVAEGTGLSLGCAYKYINHALEIGAIHIIDWIHPAERGPWRSIYAFGPGENVPKPDALPMAKRVQKYQAKIKADPDKLEQWRKQRREYRQRIKGTSKMFEGRKFERPLQPVPVVHDELLKALGGMQ